MAFSIELYFDIEFETKIRHLWDLLRDHNIPSIMHKIGSRPHLALSILDHIEEVEIPNIIRYLATNYKQFEIEFPAISMTPGKSQAVFLSPSSNAHLIDVQHRLYEHLIKKGYTPKKFYKPNKWLPHCTISKELSSKETLETFRVCEMYKVTGKATATEVGVIEFRPRKEIEKCHLDAI